MKSLLVALAALMLPVSAVAEEGMWTLDNFPADAVRERFGVELVREFGELPRVHCQAGAVNQVFLIALTNAIEAIEGAGTITLRTRCADGEVALEITDTGRGIVAGLCVAFIAIISLLGSIARDVVLLFSSYNHLPLLSLRTGMRFSTGGTLAARLGADTGLAIQ